MKQVTTRKPHQCYGCGDVFPAKTPMVCQCNIIDGSFCVTYFCLVCKHIWDEIHKVDRYAYESLFEGDLKAEDPDEWERVRVSLFQPQATPK
jgi:hypothetical protein